MGETYQGDLSVKGLSFAVVVSKFNEFVTCKLLEGAQEAFESHDVRQVDVAFVPGAVELPLVALKLAESGRYAAVVCIGAVIRGDTDHYEHVATQAASGVMRVSLDSGVPCILGVLTTINPEQALARAGGVEGNKGYEAAITAMEMATLVRTLPTD